MFGITTIGPAPLIFSAMQPGEGRVKSADFTNLLADGDTALSTPTATITRQDGFAMASADLQIMSGPALDATNKIMSVTVGRAQNVPVDYWITFSAVGATSGLTYTRSVKISIRQALG